MLISQYVWCAYIILTASALRQGLPFCSVFVEIISSVSKSTAILFNAKINNTYYTGIKDLAVSPAVTLFYLKRLRNAFFRVKSGTLVLQLQSQNL